MTTGLVLKVTRSKRRPGQFETEMVGQVRSAFRFDGMSDFQYIAPPAAAPDGAAEAPAAAAAAGQPAAAAAVADDLDNYVDVARMIDEGPAEALQLVPPIFSKIDQVQDYAFRQTPYYLYREEPAPEGGGGARLQRVARMTKPKKFTVFVK